MGEGRSSLENRIYAQMPINTVGRYDMIPIFSDPSLLNDIVSYLATEESAVIERQEGFRQFLGEP